ncbi:MAG: DEAD/DEAH box helicase, partial [Desulfobacterales bacterium]|nr:DEAD/DEAH box helicase [Desulfobacterales bacterium]
KGASVLLGHNILRHDILAAKAVSPDATFINLPVIDTLFLSPLAFPENPYHSLVKDYKLVRSGKNDPVADARLTLAVFEDQVAALKALEESRPGILGYYAFAVEALGAGMRELLNELGGDTLSPESARDVFIRLSKGKICEGAFDTVWREFSHEGSKRVVLAYVLSWVLVSGSNSVMPPWVSHRFPKITDIIRTLRYACGDDTCEYCRANNNSVALLKNYFGFDAYRTLPDGRPLQQEVIEAGLQGVSLLGILPTGGGKSICYQIPALHRYHRLGELTVIISPLKALMKDQVDNLNRATGTEVAAAINGSLTLPERGAVMEKVRLGDVGILYISPEQLRNRSVADLIRSRTVGCWVFDEAHCLSKWGHDFRPDYLHVAEFIAAYGKAVKRPPLVGTFTATAKKD